MDLNAMIKQIKDDIIRNDLMVKSLIKDILDCTTSNEDLNRSISSVSQHIRNHKTSIDQLVKVSKELSNTSAQNSLQLEIDGFKNQMEANSVSLRKAIVLSQKLITTKTREQLLGSESDTNSTLRQRNVSSVNREVLANKSSEITDSLKSVSRLLATQVTQSEDALQSLISSSATVTETGEEFKTMGSLIVHSRKLLTKYGRREVTDKVLIILALMFFFGCVFYVVTKRLFGWKYS